MHFLCDSVQCITFRPTPRLTPPCPHASHICPPPPLFFPPAFGELPPPLVFALAASLSFPVCATLPCAPPSVPLFGWLISWFAGDAFSGFDIYNQRD